MIAQTKNSLPLEKTLYFLVWAEQGSLLAADWLIRCKQRSWLADRQSCDWSCVWAGWGKYLSAFNQSASRRRSPYCRNSNNEQGCHTSTLFILSVSLPMTWLGASSVALQWAEKGMRRGLSLDVFEERTNAPSSGENDVSQPHPFL